MQKGIALVKKLLGKNVYFEQKDVTQNIFSARCIYIILLFYTFVLLLNVAGIFIVDKSIFLVGYVLIFLTAVVYFFLMLFVGLEHPLMKYINITVLTVIVMIAGITLTYHVVVVMIIPIVMSSIYTTKRLSIYAYILTLLSIVVSTYAGYFYGVCDANMVLLTATSLKNSSAGNVFLLNAVNPEPMKTLFLYFVVPRVLLATTFYLVCANVFRIIERSMENAVQMKRQAAMDDMTGLYNKNRLIEEMESHALDGGQIAVIYWDVNRLKYVNDHYGHLAGDMLIKKVADSIKAVCDGRSSAYRYGGDEFLMLVKEGNEEDAKLIVQEWEKVFEHLGSECEYPVSAAVGYVSGDGAELEKLISYADKKMYKNKMYHRK